jgi:molybdopterin-guanine dinucleotide biosynthesis protein MobB
MLVVDLVAHLKSQGYRVGTIKHTHHQHPLDTPGKDSYRHREAGADVVGIVSPGTHAAFWTPINASSRPDYETLDPILDHCDLVLVEGDSHAMAPRIEVWRAALGTPPLAAKDDRIAAIVSDDELPVPTTQLGRSDVAEVAAWILACLDVEPPAAR